jgi:hypothetical protein
MADKITKAELRVLEKMFAHEINVAMSHSKLPPIFQSKAKILDRLKDKGLVEPVEHELGGRFPMTIKGYLLTHSGRLTYCASC